MPATLRRPGTQEPDPSPSALSPRRGTPAPPFGDPESISPHAPGLPQLGVEGATPGDSQRSKVKGNFGGRVSWGGSGWCKGRHLVVTGGSWRRSGRFSGTYAQGVWAWVDSPGGTQWMWRGGSNVDLSPARINAARARRKSPWALHLCLETPPQLSNPHLLPQGVSDSSILPGVWAQSLGGDLWLCLPLTAHWQSDPSASLLADRPNVFRILPHLTPTTATTVTHLKIVSSSPYQPPCLSPHLPVCSPYAAWGSLWRPKSPHLPPLLHAAPLPVHLPHESKSSLWPKQTWSLLLPLSSPATLAWGRHIPAPGPLHWLFPQSGMPFPEIPTWLNLISFRSLLKYTMQRRAATTEPAFFNCWSLCARSSCSATREATAMRSPRTAMKRRPRSPQVEKARAGQWRPSATPQNFFF